VTIKEILGKYSIDSAEVRMAAPGAHLKIGNERISYNRPEREALRRSSRQLEEWMAFRLGRKWFW
jgi:hypothetical protein